ncbi:nuclear transport factor 2 family protein [candidate division KSB1 bacterium]
MSIKDSKYLILDFIERINDCDIAGISELTTDDVLFVDSLRGSVRGKKEMQQAWEKYFSMFPDYEISITHLRQKRDTVSILGNARGTYAVKGKLYKKNSWNIRAAWKAVIRGNRIAEWRVYADVGPIREIMAHYDNQDIR